MNLELELQERVTRHAIHLMPQPQTAIRLRKLVADPDHSLAQVVDAVKLDPMLAAAVMRIANAPSHSRGRPCTSLQAAVSRIGEKDLARLALASGLGAATSNAGPLLALRQRAMQDSLASALICEQLAPEFGLDPESLFLEGLLHDVGRLVALATLELILAQHPKAPPLDGDAWLALAQTHHVELGRMLGDRWALPQAVCHVIERHHEPDQGGTDAAAVVRFSDALLEVLHSGAALTEAQLPWLDRVPLSRRAPLLDSLAAVPSVVAAFDADRAPTEPSRHVTAPPRPTVPPTGVAFPARMSGGRVGEVVLLSERLLLLRTDTRVPDNHLVELELQLPQEVLKMWVRIVHSVARGPEGRAEAEAMPFAPTREVSQRLRSLWKAVELTERAA